MTPAAFDAWCDRNLLQLTLVQREVAYALLRELAPLHAGSGKTFLLSTVARFLKEHPV